MVLVHSYGHTYDAVWRSILQISPWYSSLGRETRFGKSSGHPTTKLSIIVTEDAFQAIKHFISNETTPCTSKIIIVLSPED